MIASDRPSLAFERPLPIPSSGVQGVDDYIRDGFERVPGMSSTFSAAIVAGLLQIQSENGQHGHVIEIGVFEGRFLLAMARALAADEIAIGIDTFDWPDQAVLQRFRDHCARQGLEERVVAFKSSSAGLGDGEVRALLGGHPCRLIHVDGDHSPASASGDLGLCDRCLDAQGLIVVDDVLHPNYPRLTLALFEFLDQRPGWRVLCAIDRTSLVGAAKYVLCRTPYFAIYDGALRTRFRRHVWPVDADMGHYRSMILSCDQSYLPSMMQYGVRRR